MEDLKDKWFISKEVQGIIDAERKKKGRDLTEQEFKDLLTPIVEKALTWKMNQDAQKFKPTTLSNLIDDMVNAKLTKFTIELHLTGEDQGHYEISIE